MKAELVKSFHFDAAHALPNVPPGHKCAASHGHSYQVDIHITGEVDPHAGWVMDFGDIKRIVAPLIDQLDHHNLNEVEGLANSTSEVLARWLWVRIEPHLPGLSAIVVHESTSARCIYRGE